MVIASWKILLLPIVPYLRMHRSIFHELPESSQGCCTTVHFLLWNVSPFSSWLKSAGIHPSAVLSEGSLCIKQPSLESSLYSASGVLAGSVLSVRIEVHSLFLDSQAARLKLALCFGVNNKCYLTLNWRNSFET